MKTKGFVSTLLTLFVCITASAETWTDANGTEWYFTTDGSNATISSRGWDNVNSCNIPPTSGIVPTDLAIPSIVYVGETPYSVTAIGNDAFSGCSSLTSIIISEGVTSIGDGAFFECSSLISITIPEGVTCIRPETFNGCSSLRSITLPESVTSILDFSFWDCSSLISITIPEGVTSIGPAFDGCRSLKSIIVGMKNPAIQIATIAFSEHYETATLYVPKGSKAAYQAADIWKDFKNIIEYDQVDTSQDPPIIYALNSWTDANGTEWHFITNGNQASLTTQGWDEDNSCFIPTISGTIPEDLTIPSTVYVGETPYIVKAFHSGVFDGCSNLTSITIPEGVTYIGNGSFRGCSSLTSITIPDGITNIENSMFMDCSSLASITIPESVKSIEGFVFWGCSSLTSVTIPEGVTTIGNYAFNGCSKLTSVIACSQTPIDLSMNSSTFVNQEKATLYVPYGSKATYQAADVWKDFKNILEYNREGIWTDANGTEWYFTTDGSNATISNRGWVDMNGYIPSISGAIPYALTIPSTVYIGDTPYPVTSIGFNAFEGCSSLTSITIPDGVTTIEGGVFMNCSNLTSITIPDGVTSNEVSWFANCSSLTSVTLPDGIISIGNYAFQNCSSLKFITIPGGVNSIGVYAFYGCSSLTSITIPEKVTSIDDYAFAGCNGLSSIIVEKQTPIDLSMNSSTFENCDDGTLYVPAGSKAAYQAAEVWKNFKEIIEYNYVDGSQDPPVSEFSAALTAITDGFYYLTTEVNGTQYYVTQNGYLTNDKESAYLFAISKDSGSSVNDKLYDVAFLIDPDNGAHFSNPTPLLDGKAYLHLGFFYQDKYNNRSEWERQVLFLNETGKFAIRSSNVTYGEDGWLDAGRTFWSWEENGSIIPCYSYEPAYIWALEEPVGKVKLYLILDDLYTLYENQLYDDVDNPDYVNMGSGYGQYADWVTWRKFKAELDKLDALIQKFLDEDYNPELDSDCPDLDGVNAWKTEIAALWQKILDSKVTDISELDNAIYIEPFTARVGENVQMEICLKNADVATAYVFDLVLPEGITVATNDKGKYIDELSDRHDDHTRTINYKGENTYSLSTLSGNSEELTGNDGAIRLVTIAVSDNVAEGNYAIEIKNASYSKPDGTLVSLPDTRAVVTVEDYVLGDVNGNGGVDIGDAVSIVNYLVGKDSSNFVEKAADTNKNGQIDIGDAVTIVNLLVGKITSFTREFNIIWDEKEPE